MQSLTLRAIGVFGCLLFIPLFFLTFLSPQTIENSGKSFIAWKLQSTAKDKVNSFNLPETNKFEVLLGKKAKELREKTKGKLAKIKNQLTNSTPEIIAQELENLQKLDCPCREAIAKNDRQSMNLELLTLEKAKLKLIEFTQLKYMEIVTKLTLDVRIFLGANGFIFLFLLLASFFKPKAIKHLFLPSGLILISTSICSYFYLFEQNWFYTIIYNNYTGYSFVAYLLIIFAILSDIAFNKARVTTEIINMILEVIGHSVSKLVPC